MDKIKELPMAPPKIDKLSVTIAAAPYPSPDGAISNRGDGGLSTDADQATLLQPLSTPPQQCGGGVFKWLANRTSLSRDSLFPSALTSAFSFHPFVTPQEFRTAYSQAKAKILALHQRLVDPTYLQTQSIDTILEDLNRLDQGLDTIESIINSIHATPPDLSFVSLMETYGAEWEMFIATLLSSEPFYQLIVGLKQKLKTDYNGKHNKALVEATLEKWIDKITFKSGVGLPPDKKSTLEKARGELKKAEFEYARALALTATTWMHFDPMAMIGFKQDYNERVVTWIGRLFVKGEEGLKAFLTAYNSSKDRPTVPVTQENLAVSIDIKLIKYLKETYFINHPEEFITDENRFLEEYRAHVKSSQDSAKESAIDWKKINIREFYDTYLIQHPDRADRIRNPLGEIVKAVEKKIGSSYSTEKYADYLSSVERIVTERKKHSLRPDLKIPIVRSAKNNTEEFSDFIDHTPSERSMVYAFGVHWKNLDKLVTPKAIEILRIRGKIAEALGFSNYAELKSLQGQTLFANPQKELAHWLKVGSIVREITQKHWSEVVALQKRIRPKGLPPTYETSQPYHDLVRQKNADTRRLMTQLEFGPPEVAVRQITMPNIAKIYGQSYPEITGALRAAYPLYHPDVLVFGNDCSVYTWDLFDHPGKKSAASVAGSSCHFREMGNHRNYFANILLTLPSRSSNPQTKLDHLMTMIHEPGHSAPLLTPVNGQNDFFNLSDPVELLNDFLTRFSEREYLTKGVPEGVDFWKLGTLPEGTKRRSLTPSEIEDFKKSEKLNILEGFERSIPRGIFSYDLHIGEPKTSQEMARRFIEIAKETYNEPFANKDTAFARAVWSGGFGSDNYGPAATTAYLNPDLFYPYFSSLFENVGGGLNAYNFHLLQEMLARVSAMKPPKKGGEGWIENLEKSVNQMLSEIHIKYGNRVKKIPHKFDIEDVYKRFEDYYKKAI